jgi:predicted nucleic acid-binding protein
VAKPVVIDASVAAKWFLKHAGETDTDLADDLLLAILADDVDAHGPGIFTREVCNLLAKAIGGQRLTKDEATECASEFFKVPVTIHDETEDQLCTAIQMAADHSKTFYDMTYVRLAVELSCRWCTADEKFLKTLPSTLGYVRFGNKRSRTNCLHAVASPAANTCKHARCEA